MVDVLFEPIVKITHLHVHQKSLQSPRHGSMDTV